MKPERTRRSLQQAKEEILAAAEAVLRDVSYSSLTVDQVMRGTGMTRSSFYHYFDTLDDLLLCLLKKAEQDVRDSVCAWLKGEIDGDYRLSAKQYFTAMFGVIEEHRVAISAAQAANNSSRVYQQWQERVVGYFIELTTSFIHQQVILGRSSVADPARLANALILMNNAVSSENLSRTCPDKPEELAGIISSIWNAAIYD